MGETGGQLKVGLNWAGNPQFANDHLRSMTLAQMAPLEREQAELKPVSVTSTNGIWTVDFGRCIDGWPKLTMHANRSGDIVRIEYFQMSGERKPSG